MNIHVEKAKSKYDIIEKKYGKEAAAGCMMKSVKYLRRHGYHSLAKLLHRSVA